MSRRIVATTTALVLALALTGCVSDEQRHEEKKRELAERSQLAAECRDAGGRYVLTIPPGYTSASYWCLWDEEREGGEW